MPKRLGECLRYHSTVRHLSLQIRNFYSKLTYQTFSSSVFMCEAKLHLHKTLDNDYLKLNFDTLFRYRISRVFSQDLILKVICLFYSLGFMESSTPTYKF